MPLKRKMYDQLLRWKRESAGASAIFVDGARRVGKSFICAQFARAEYKSCIIVDFGQLAPEVRTLFDDTSDLDLFFLRLCAFYGVTLHQRESVIVFDEVQLFPPARQLIKYLVADGRYDYIETGSLVTLRKDAGDILIPSEEEHVEMFPLDFEEFCWAQGDEATFPALREFYRSRRPLGRALHQRMMERFRVYMLVGGMPQAVAAYLEHNDFAAVDSIKRRILTLYRQDITKFAKGYEARVLSIFDGIPGRLAQKEKKYRLASLGKNARRRDYEDAFVWLDDAMVVNTCLNATDPAPMLAASADHETQKLYMGDTGLLVTLAFWERRHAENSLYRAVLFDKISVNEGMLAENIAAQMLRPHYRRLYFYSRSDAHNRENMMEIDFLLPGAAAPFPVEVKSGRYRPHTSLDKFTRKFKGRIGQPVILYTKDIMEADGILHLPMYMAGLLGEG